MKTCKLLKMSLFLGLLCLLMSCSEKEENQLVGSWKRSTMTSDLILLFKADGTFVYESTGGSFGREGRGTYAYNDEQQTLSLSYTSKYRTDIYIVQTLETKTLVLLDPEDLYAWSFVRM